MLHSRAALVNFSYQSTEQCPYPLRPKGGIFPVEDADLLLEVFFSIISTCEFSDAGVSWDVFRVVSFAKLPAIFVSDFCCCLNNRILENTKIIKP